MKTFALFRGVTMSFVIGHFRLRSYFAGFVLIGFDHLKSNRSQIMGRSFSYKMLKGVRPTWLGLAWLLLVVPLLTSLPQLVLRLGTSDMVIFSRSTSDQDLLCSCVDVIRMHGVFVCSFEQVIHCFWRFFSEKLEEQRTQTNASLEDL